MLSRYCDCRQQTADGRRQTAVAVVTARRAKGVRAPNLATVNGFLLNAHVQVSQDTAAALPKRAKRLQAGESSGRQSTCHVGERKQTHDLATARFRGTMVQTGSEGLKGRKGLRGLRGLGGLSVWREWQIGKFSMHSQFTIVSIISQSRISRITERCCG